MSSERTGRRPGESGTKEKILSAALDLFSTRGYGGATIRSIAERAQVDPALVHHFYGNKDGIFRAAVESALEETGLFASPDDAEAEAEAQAGTDPAERVVREHLDYWEAPATGAALAAIYRTGLADEAVSVPLRARVEAGILASARRTGAVTGTDRDAAGLLPAHLIGLGVVRHVLRIEPLASLAYDDFLAWIVPAVRLQLAPAQTAPSPSKTKPRTARKAHA